MEDDKKFMFFVICIYCDKVYLLYVEMCGIIVS